MSVRSHVAYILIVLLVAGMLISCGDDDDGDAVGPVAPGVEWTIQSTGTDRPLFDVARSDTLWVAVGGGGTVLTSTDGEVWTTQVTDIDVDLFSVASNDQRFVAVGNEGRIETSEDGVVWTTADSTLTGRFFFDVVWSGEAFVAVGQGGLIAASPDGLSWELLLNSVNRTLFGISFIDSQFIAVGDQVIARFDSLSLGGIDSLEVEVLATPPVVLYDVAANDSLRFAVGQRGTILKAVNDTTWEAIISGLNAYFYAVEWSGTEFVAVGENGNVLTSPDGELWTLISTFEDDLRGLSWDGMQFYAVGLVGTILASPDGLDWEPLPSGPNAILHGVAYDDSAFVAVGDGGTALVSQNGEVWTRWPTSTASQLRAITSDRDLFVAVGAAGTIVTTADGIQWTVASSPVSEELEAVTGSGSRFVAVGDQGRIVWSDDAATWNAVAGAPVSTPLRGVVWADGQFVAVGASSVVLTSPDGTTWSADTVDFTTPLNLTSIAYANGQLVATADDGHVLLSSTASTWQVLEARPGDVAVYSLNHVVYNGNRWVAVGTQSAEPGAADFIVALYSTDAISWEVGRVPELGGELHGVAWGDNRFVTVGEVDIGEASNVTLILTSP